MAAIIIVQGCGADEPETVVYRGRSLELHLMQPEIVESLAFVDELGQHRILRPKASNRQLALVNVAVVNRTSTITSLFIDGESAQIGDRRTDRIYALDPFEDADIADSAGPEENRYAPLLWGEIELQRNFQAKGYMVFDVPKGLILGSIWWKESDDIIADFIEYRRERR